MPAPSQALTRWGRLRFFATQWAKLEPRPLGVQFDFGGIQVGIHEQTSSKESIQGYTPVPSDPAQRWALEGEIAELLRKEAIRPTSVQESKLLFRSSFFLTPKKPDKWRPILNLKPFNKSFLRPRKFRMETLASILPSLACGMWATSLDIQDAYLHIPMHPACTKFLAFHYRKVDYVFTCLPFGLSTAPRVFTRVSKTVVAFLRGNGIVVFAYLDDWLTVSDSEGASLRDTNVVVSLLEDLGWVINVGKSCLVPSQKITYLGADIDLVSGRVFPSSKRVRDLSSLADSFQPQGSYQARVWLQLLGMMASLTEILPLCRLHMRPVQFHVLLPPRLRRTCSS